jgi:hypothetical protein
MSNHRSIDKSPDIAGTGSQHRRVLRGGAFNNNPRNEILLYFISYLPSLA